MSTVSRRAVIDIGTNSVKLLVGEVSSGSVAPLFEDNRLTRLGRGLYEEGLLAESSMADTEEAARHFSQKAESLGATQLRVIATSATRDAKNGDELVERLKQATRVEPRILSGQEEARMVLDGILTDPRLQNRNLLITDIGGGSTELILTRNGELVHERSFQMGTVRILEAVPPQDPPSRPCREGCDRWLDRIFRDEVLPGLSGPIRETGDVTLVTTGGTSTILARIHLETDLFEREKIESVILQRNQVAAIHDRLWSCSLSERQKITGLPADRADVMPAGSAIYLKIFQHLGFKAMNPSTRGLRFGALL